MLTKYGKKEWLFTAIISATLSLITLLIASIFKIYALNILSFLLIILWVPFALFFRDPYRKIPLDDSLILSPADGVIKDIEIVDCPFSSGNKYKRIGIFLSVFDVHINRMPLDLTVIDVKYKEGNFHDARSSLASSENESNTILCEAEYKGEKFNIIIKQISGAIARRIVSEATPGKRFKRGEKFGMIKFGSRTELYLPNTEDILIKVSIGDKVYAGNSIIATFKA
ncbi:MAG TPA: phosphatidylserine decarboxylase [Victivallales bacterium]|nr:phosphatidylserine decarboxylase [Victivallales bacterium]HPO90987.1 phosphatidylserine decarboxylase [Victivallales bacterium]HRR28243.1 phosphatidylserine decarboxylase [Victivallales bacterium]HRU01700.1 phosphatidylserine decarboxylase [Victivallales bacterium]